MPVYILDASSLCKRYFTNEIGADLIKAIFDDVTSMRYLLNISVLEILNAIYRVNREGHLSKTECDALIAAFYKDIADGHLLIFSIHDLHIFNAESILQKIQAVPVIKKRPGPIDALVVACAGEFNPADLVLVSADTDLNALARHFAIPTFDPEKPFSPVR